MAVVAYRGTTYVATNTSFAVAAPSTTATGDLLLAIVNLNTGFTSEPTTAGGWTRIGGTPASPPGGGVYAYWKVATAPGATSDTWTINTSTGYGSVNVHAFSGVNSSTPINASAFLSSPTGLTAPTVTTSVSNALVLTNFGYTGNANAGGGTLAASACQSTLYEGNGTVESVYLGGDQQATPGASGTRTLTSYYDSTPSKYGAATIALTPRTTTVPPTVRGGQVPVVGVATSQVGTGTWTSNFPGSAAGDLALFMVTTASNTTGLTLTPPSGWSLVAADTAPNNEVWTFSKIVQNSDINGASQLFNFSASVNATVATAVVQDVNQTSPINVAGAIQKYPNGTTVTSATAPGITTSQTGTLLLPLFTAAGALGNATSTVPSGFSLVVANTYASGQWIAVLASTAAAGAPAGAQPAVTQQFNGASTASGASAQQFAINGVSTAPSAPTLTAPTSASYTDLAVNGGPFTWTYNNGDGTTQQSYSFRRKISGAASYEYWNVSTGAFQSTEVFNTSASGSLTFAAGKWTDGNTYQWSVNTTSSAGLAGTYASDFTVNASGPPAVSVTSPTGTQVTGTPTVTWTTTVQGGLSESQTAWQVVVETGAYGSVPGSGSQEWTSGVVSGAATSVVVGTSLANQASHRAFVQVTETGGQVSAWGYTSFSIGLDPPATPTLTSSWDVANQRAVVAVTGLDNLLSTNTASIETDATGWAALNSTAVRSTAMALDGSASLLVTAAAVTGNYGAYSTPAVTVVPGQVYSGLVSVRASSGAPAPAAAIEWHDSTNAVISAVTGPRITTNTTAWQQSAITGTAPANAVTALLTVYSTPAAATTDAFYLDAAAIMPGTTSVWYRGGLAGLGTALVEKSTDNGLTWAPVRAGSVALPTPSQTATVYDYELVPGSSALYRARVQDVQ